MDKHLIRSDKSNRVISSSDAFQLLVRNATNQSPIEKPNSEGIPSQLDGHIKSSQRELLEVARSSIASKPDSFQLADKLLEYVVQQFQKPADFNNLIRLLEPSPTIPASPTVRLIAFCQLARSAHCLSEHVAQVSLGYAQVLESLLTSDTSQRSSLYVSLYSQFAKIVSEIKPWMKALDLYCMLLVAESKCANEKILALDLFSDSLETVMEYTRTCDVDVVHQDVCGLVASAIVHRKDALDCLKAFKQLQPMHSALPELSLAESNRFLKGLIESSKAPADDISVASYWCRRLRQRDQSGHASRLFETAMIEVSQALYHRPTKITDRLGAVIDSLLDENVDTTRLQSISASILRGDYQTIDDVIVGIQRICELANVESVAGSVVLTGTDLQRMERMQTKRGSQLVSPELLRMRLDRWQKLSDIHRGFTSWLVAAKRGPFREPPDLVQFAIDVGDETSVRYLNAQDPNGFPGKGYFLTRLKVERCFAPESPRNLPRPKGHNTFDPFRIYKTAWPDLAEAIDHFNKAEFVFLRGFVLVSCKHRDFLLPNSQGEHYSLLIFNDHFRNPFQEVAYLVPNRGIAGLLAKTQIPYSDFVGFDSRRPDLNKVMGSQQAFLSHESIGPHAIDVGSVSAILNGFSAHNFQWAEALRPKSELAKFREIEGLIAQHNADVKEWESRSHLYHISPKGLMAMARLMNQGHVLEREQSKLATAQAELEDHVEKTIWKLVDRYISLHQLFHIAHAYWHKGYTAGRPVATQAVSESSEWLDGPSIKEQDDLKIEGGEESIANRNSIRMLVQAYEWHSMRENPHYKREDFPVLVKCDALQLGSQPELDWHLDTFDMMATIRGHRVPLTQGRMTVEDELFWLSQMFPLVHDEAGRIVDLRFYPRSSLGIP
ncbi:MAG: hypothetical protein MUC83_06570 [Pirellula sp.]|jgi:hypothetical protein|nr:hypothetical protein [Pirellula sp.]